MLQPELPCLPLSLLLKYFLLREETMDFRFNKSLLVILSLSSLLLSTNAVPSTRIIDFISTSFPTAGHKSRIIDYISTSVPAVASSSRHIDFPSISVPAAAPSSGVIVSGDSNVILEHASQSGATLLGNIADRAAYRAYPEIMNLCIDGENVALCVETILKEMNGPFDPLKALEIEVDATLVQAKTVAGTIQKLLQDPSTDKKAMEALGICHSQYGDMLDAIKEAVDLLQQQNVVDAYYKFNAVIAYKSACDDAFVESPGVKIPFSQDSETLFQLGGNSLGIMNELVNHVRI
ncbi:uncharacterized protein LOC127097808 [Lathyrus oleraceus]|uniref:uncharacterized protein LOC127097808 n=1 Tax=Pisum sativum TaxID=3888 RepID=UPI001FC5B9B6|nr:uncharacterized protein LOC127097808 [Pisum sativum]